MTFEELAADAAEAASACLADGARPEDIADAYLITAAHIVVAASNHQVAAEYLRNLASHLEALHG